MAERNMLSEMADFFKNYLSDEKFKTQAYGKPNPTKEEMDAVGMKMAEKYFPEESMMTPEELAAKKKEQEAEAAKTPATTVKYMAPAMTTEDLIKMRDERTKAAAVRARETADKVMGK